MSNQVIKTLKVVENELKGLFSVPSGPTKPTSSSKLWKNQWTCPVCTFSANVPESSLCDACSTPRAGQWNCKHCTLINSASNGTCGACKTPKSGQPTPVAKPTGWHCPNCTFLNSMEHDNCHICDEFKSVDTWNCALCSRRNNASQKKCQQCGNEKAPPAEKKVEKPPPNDNNNSLYESFHRAGKQATSIIDTYRSDEHQAKQIWNNIVKYCRENGGTHFVDDSFPPCDKSLFIGAKRPPQFVTKRIEWLRPEHIRGTSSRERSLQWSVYNGPSFNDIKQGTIGNCWFLSAIAVLIEQPDLLDKIIITKEYCAFGVYQVRLCNNGQWQTVVLDDLFPCDEHGFMLYSKANRKQLWVALIEKAMAKIHGSYAALIAGHTVEGLASLTGFPCETIKLDSEYEDMSEEERRELVWARLLSLKEAAFLMGASCGRTGMPDDQFQKLGLLAWHAYSLLDVREVGGNRLLHLRNPWGKHVWNGRWANGSKEWTPELRRALGRGNDLAEDQGGLFWMSFNDFANYFCTVDVCKVRRNWTENRLSGFFASPENATALCYHLVVFETCEIDISLFLNSSKNRQESIDFDLSFLVLRYGKPPGRLVTASKRQVRKFIHHSHIFEPGEYMVVPLSFNFWFSVESNCGYNLVMHGSKTFFMDQEVCEPNILADCLIEMCVRKGVKASSRTHLNANIYTLTKDWSGLLVVAENLDQRNYFHVEVDAEQSINMVSTRQSLNTYDSVPPLSRQVLMVLSHLESAAGYNIHYSYRYKLSTSKMVEKNGAKFSNHPALRLNEGLHAPRPI